MQDSMQTLWSKSDRYYMGLLSGAYVGRRVTVWDLFQNYMEQFREIATNIFSYESDVVTPDLARQIEKRYFYFGRCGLVIHNGELTAVTANKNGFDEYNEPTGFTFTYGGGQPDHNKTPQYREIGKDGVLGRNTFSFYPTAMFCEQYALMAAHADMSIIAEMVNGRFMDVIKTHTASDAETARAFNNALYDGKLAFLEDKKEEIEIDRSPRAVSHLRELIDAKERILKDFYGTFGVSRVAEKRERMITDEVDANEKMLLLNLKDMLEQRKKMCDELWDVFGVDVSVKSHIDIDNNGQLDHEQEAEGGAADGSDI